MRLDAFDPTETARESVSLDVHVDRFFFAYYLPFVTVLSASTSIEVVGDATVATIAGLGLRFGLQTDVVELIRLASEERRFEGLASQIRSRLERSELRGGFGDGAFFETDWNDALSTPDSRESLR